MRKAPGPVRCALEMQVGWIRWMLCVGGVTPLVAASVTPLVADDAGDYVGDVTQSVTLSAPPSVATSGCL